MSEADVRDALEKAKAAGIRNILALRGDPPHGQERWVATEGGFTCALDLIKHIKKEYKDHFGIACAGYPEGHPVVRKEITDKNWDPKTNTPAYWAVRPIPGQEGKFEGVSPEDWKKEQQYLKSKVDAGAEFIVTQLFYDLEIFYAWVKDCRKIGIKCPILPGIMPFFKAASFKRMTGFCKTVVPQEIWEQVEKYEENTKENHAAFQAFGVTYLTQMCRDLLSSGVVPSIHLYTLNNQKVPYAILDALGFPKTATETQLLYSTFSVDLTSKQTSTGWRGGLEKKTEAKQ